MILLLAAAVMPSDPIVVFVLADNIQGTSGDDTLNGTPESDIINGFEGNDIIFGEGGGDTLDGGKGEDEIHGADGNDEIKDGNDDPPETGGELNEVYGGSGNDNIDVGIDYTRSDFYYVYGEDGSDYIEVVSNADIKGGPDNDTIYCTGYECIVNGDEGDDEIHIEAHNTAAAYGASGGSGNDELYIDGGGSIDGNDGNDYLWVKATGDLQGGEGDDILEGLLGDSYYHGGAGADTFKCSPGRSDVVLDYNPGEGDTVSDDCETVQDTTTTTPPDVQITKATDNKGKEVISDGGTTKSRSIKVTFEATDAVGIDNLECSLDGKAFTSCTSPVVYDKLSKGLHEFTVRATDVAGDTGQDEFTWTIGKLQR